MSRFCAAVVGLALLCVALLCPAGVAEASSPRYVMPTPPPGALNLQHQFAAYADGNPAEIGHALRAAVDWSEETKAFSKERASPLMYAAAANDQPEVIALIAKKFPVNQTNRFGQTALMFAAAANPDPAMTRALLEAGAKINARDDDDNTALDWALLLNPNPEVAETLLAAKARADLGQAFNRAWARGANPYQDLLDDLLPVFGPMPPREIIDGQLLSHDFLKRKATDDEWAEMNRRLTKRRAMRGQAPLLMRAVLAADADINARDNQGRTVLHVATKVSVIDPLLAAGADVGARDKQGRTALWWKDLESTQRLLAAGADLNARDDNGAAVLMWTSDEKLLGYLLEVVADPKAADNDGRDALMYAAQGRNPEVVKRLLAFGLDPEAKDKEGRNALDLAKRVRSDSEDFKERNKEIRAILKQAAR